MTDRSSAIPRRLLTYANTEAATMAALQERATMLNQAIADFKARCTEFPTHADTPLAGRLNTHAEQVGGLGLFAGRVALGFARADKGQGPDLGVAPRQVMPYRGWQRDQLPDRNN